MHNQPNIHHTAIACIATMLFAFFMLAGSFSLAQNYPVQVNVNVGTPCPVRLSSLFPGASSRVNLMVLLTDISQPELQVRLRITLEGPGLTLTTRPEFLPIPFTLYGGMPVSLQTELAPYFTTSSLMASGSAAGSFTQSGMLPEGMYKLTVQAIEHRRNVVVSNTAMAMAWAIYNDPPEPILPMSNQVVDAGSMQNVLFTWAPRHILTPGAGGQIGYTLSLWEIPQGVNPELAVQTLPAIGTIESYSPTAIWGADRPMLIPGKQYAYRIQAADPTGEVAFKNNGNSVVRAFTFGTPCSKPVNLSHSEVTIQSAKTAWVPMGSTTNFAVEYRPALEEPVNWRSYEVEGSTTTLSSLAPATEYKYRVKSVCGSYHSDPTAEKSFTTLPLPNLDNLCTGDAVAPPVANAPLLDNLSPLQVISAGGFLVTIDEVTRTAPYTFSGKGRIAMPLFGISVQGTFKNIQVNNLLQLTAGKVESVKSETLTVVGGSGSNPNGPGVVDFGNITDTVHITSPIDTVYMNPDSTWTVVTEGGQTVTIPQPADGTGVLVVDPNGNGVVITADRYVPYTAGGSNGNGTTTPITPTTLCDEQVEFTPSGSMHRYGYDPYRADAASLYQQLQVGTQTLNLAYKSVPQGATDVVYIEPKGNGILNGITYAYQSGAALTANPAGSSTKSLYLPAPAGGSDNLLALCSMDTTSREAAVAGALSVVSYPLTRHRVVVVPVGNAQPTFSVSELQTQLNAIYAPAVIEWEVTQLPAVTATYWDENNDSKLQIPQTDYSPEMRGVWQAFLASSNATPGTAYLFIVSAFDSAQYQGYMPIRSSYGFLTPSASPRSAAHELGHGLFNLRHTFSSENAVTLQQGSTQNLMDYSTGSELWKYQWDYTHNPEGGWFVFEDSEEGGMVQLQMSEETVLEIINNIRTFNINNESRLNMEPYIISSGHFDNTFKIGEKIFNNFDIQIYGLQKFLDRTINETFEIKPSKISKANVSSSGKVSGDFIKYTFNSFKETPNAPFEEQFSDSPLLEIRVDENDAWEFEQYLFNLTPKIKITTTNIESDSLYTLSSFSVDNGNILGYLLERPFGTAEEERTEGSLKRIPSGTYSVCYPYGVCRPETTRTNRQNELWVKTNGEYDQFGGFITRNYILIHIGNEVWDSEGCILPGSGHQKFTLVEDFESNSTGELYTTGTIMEKVTGSTILLNNTLSPYLMNKINALKALGIDKNDYEFLEIEILINR